MKRNAFYEDLIRDSSLDERIYVKIFTIVPPLKFINSVLQYYDRFDLREDEKYKMNRLVEAITETENFGDYAGALLQTKFCNAETMLKLTEKYCENSAIASYLLKSSKFDSDCMNVMLKHAEENPEVFFENDANKSGIGMMMLLNDWLPISAFIKYADSPSSRVRCAVAYNSNCPQEILEKLSNDSDISVVKAVAQNPKTDNSVLSRLAEHVFVSVRECVAWNRNASEEVLRKLSDDEEFRVKESVAKHPNCPTDVLEKFAKFESENIDEVFVLRRLVALNRNISDKIVKMFLKEKNTELRNLIIVNPKCPIDAINLFDVRANNAYAVMKDFVVRSDIPDYFTEVLLEKWRTPIRKCFFEEFDFSEETLRKYYKDSRDQEVKLIILRKSKSEDFLWRIIRYKKETDISRNVAIRSLLRSCSVQKLLEVLKFEPESKRNEWISYYFNNGPLSEKDCWYAYQHIEMAYCFPENPKDQQDKTNLRETMLLGIANNIDLSEDGLYKFVKTVIESSFIVDKEKLLMALTNCDKFYTTRLIDYCFNALKA